MAEPTPLDPTFEFGNDLAVVGKYNPDPQGDAIVTGKYMYSNDHLPGRKLYAAQLGSPYAHAKITSINTSKAEAVDGVEAVITYQDNPTWSDTMLCWGQEFAAVAATDPYTAERALDLIEVEWQELPFIIDPVKAMQPGADLVGTFPDSNISSSPRRNTRGDTEAGFAQADVIVEVTTGFCTPHTQNTIEPCSGIAWWEGDHVYGYDQNQNPHSSNRNYASALGVPISKCHISVIGTGGGFGGSGQTNEPVTCALLSKKAGKPVAMSRERRYQTPSRRNHYSPSSTIKMGCKNDGTMTAFEVTIYADGGRNASSGGNNYWEVYESTWLCPNLVVEVYGVATNKGFGAGYRCLAHPEGGLIFDKAVHEMAAKLNMTPLEFMRKNFVKADTPNQDTGNPMTTYGLGPALEKAAEVIDYEAKYHEPGAKTLPDGRKHGIGIHAHNDRHGTTRTGRGIIINIKRDGSINYNTGQSRQQTGAIGGLSAIIAEALGATYDQVDCGAWGNPSNSPDGGSQGGSTGQTTNGAAALMAALDVRQQLFDYAAGQLKVTPEELDAREGKIFVKADPTQSITHAQVMAKIAKPIIGVGKSFNNDLRRPFQGFPAGTTAWHRTGTAAAYEVAVDTETGEVEILDYVNVCDAGRVIHRFGAEGQISSGQQAHFNKTFIWDVNHDPQRGVLLNQTMLDMKHCTTMDVPIDKNNFVLLETVNAVGAFGGNGIGEPASTPGYAALFNAVNNALGTDFYERPIPTDKILKALGKA